MTAQVPLVLGTGITWLVGEPSQIVKLYIDGEGRKSPF